MEEVKLTPYIKVRQPTKPEIESLETHWLVSPGATRSDSKKVRRNPVMEQPEQASWTERLGNCPQATADKTLEATTQYYDESVAAET